MTKIVLHHNMSDITYLKEFMSYEMMEEVGVAKPRCMPFTNISINGETWEVYLFVESIEESFIAKNYGTTEGNLYKPDSDMIGGGGFRGMISGKNGMNLVYTTDDISDYSGITDSAVFSRTNVTDFQKLIPLIRNMSTGENLENTMNVDEFV